jgi:hypothetical protein
MFKYETTRRQESATFPGVFITLRKMTEGRRTELRRLIAEPNSRLRGIMREQAELDKLPEDARDMASFLELQDRFDEILMSEVNPAWVRWGVKMVDGLEVDGRTLAVEDFLDWPSVLFAEVVDLVKTEAELDGAERKNSALPTTSGEQGGGNRTPSTAPSADEGGTSAGELVQGISQVQ